MTHTGSTAHASTFQIAHGTVHQMNRVAQETSGLHKGRDTQRHSPTCATADLVAFKEKAAA